MEFPAGLIDEGEDIYKCGLRELKEETGYTGEIFKELSNPNPFKTPVSPWISDESTKIICAKINGDDPLNKNPV